MTLEDQLFGEVVDLGGQATRRMPVDGIMGLGLGRGFASSAHWLKAKYNCSDQIAGAANINVDGLANDECLTQGEIDEKFHNLLENLSAQKLLKEPIYSLYLNGENENRNVYNAHNGELIFGEIVEDYYVGDNITYTPVTRADFWEFTLERVALENANGAEMEIGCESGCPVIVDTGSHYIGGHFVDVDRLNRKIGALPQEDGMYSLGPCELTLLPDLIFHIGGQKFSLKPEQYIEKVYVGRSLVTCISALKVIDSERYPFWTLGELFLKRHYIVFDFGQRRLGFAKSRPSDPIEVELKLKRYSHYFGRKGASA